MPKRKLVSFDWAMKKLLRSKVNFDIQEGFLSELLKKEQQVKFNRVNLKVRNQDNELVIIEVQIARKLLAAGGLDIQSIAAMTDLSVEEVNLLKNKEENI